MQFYKNTSKINKNKVYLYSIIDRFDTYNIIILQINDLVNYDKFSIFVDIFK